MKERIVAHVDPCANVHGQWNPVITTRVFVAIQQDHDSTLRATITMGILQGHAMRVVYIVLVAVCGHVNDSRVPVGA